MSDIATYIKCMMERADVSPVELARVAGISRTTLSKILRGRSDGTISTLNKIFAQFGCYITVRRRRDRTTDIDKETGELRLPFDDPLENNPMLEKIRNRKVKTERPR